MNVAIIGLGLIGGSLAKAFKSKTKHFVVGCDADPGVVEKALQTNAIDEELKLNDLDSCDLVLVALYPQDAVCFVMDHAKKFKKGGLVVDTCGVKRSVCAPLFETAKQNGFVFRGGPPHGGIGAFWICQRDRQPV
jgi:prephenate dehydrogenase